MDFGLERRTAAVAGSSAGLGFAVAAALVAEGAQVAICGRELDRVTAAAQQLGSGCIPLTADVSTPTGAAAFVQQANARLGRVDIVIANGPGPAPGGYFSTEVSHYQAALDQSLLAVVAMCKAAVPGMVANGWGRIVAITSISARQPLPDLILSNTARAGVTGFLKTLSTEVAHSGVTVNSVQPGLHDTARVRAVYGQGLDAALGEVPVRRLGEPRELAALVTFLCSEQAGYITGVAVPVDGGFSAGLQ